MRYTHILRRNEKCESPTRCIWLTLDIRDSALRGRETVGEWNVGVMLHGVKDARTGKWAETWFTIRKKDAFWRVIEKVRVDKTKIYVFVTDSSRTLACLDIFTEAQNREWKLQKAILPKGPTILQWRNGLVTLLLSDSANYWQTPLYAQSNGDITPERCGKNGEAELSPSALGLKRYTRHLMEKTTAWMRFLQTEDFGGFSPTLASQALRTFRHKFMSHQILVDNNEDALQLARSAYYGGRTECSYIGREVGEFYLVDINSHYASIMRDLYVPIRLRGYTSHATVADVLQWCKSQTCVGDCELRTEVPMYPVRERDKLVFPVGSFRTQLAGAELEYAAVNGHIQAIHAVAIYDTALAFRSFVDTMWSRRRAAIASGDLDNANHYKRLLASFYGKWGQSGGIWEKIDDTDSSQIKTWSEIDYDTGIKTDFRQFGGIVQKRSDQAESSDSHPAIAACITAAARLKLWQLICCAKKENVYYVDTDSLLVNRAGFDLLGIHISPDTLGGLRLEGRFQDISIHACKDYVFDLRKKRKGVAATDFVVTDDTFECSQKNSLSAMIRGGDMSQAITTKISKHLLRTYEKGTVLASGRVEPYRR